MPNRILKESICTSDSIDALDWFAEVLFYRLIVNCDDFGRFDGRIAVIKNRLFPLKDGLTLKNVEVAVNKLASLGLVCLYKDVNGKPFLFLPSWNEHQQVRNKRSKYPDPPDTRNQLLSDDSNCPRNPIQSESLSESLSESESEPARGAATTAEIKFDPVLQPAVDAWLKYKQERGDKYCGTALAALYEQIETYSKQYGSAAVANIIAQSMGNNYSGITFDKLSKISKLLPNNQTPDYSDLEKMMRNLEKIK